MRGTTSAVCAILVVSAAFSDFSFAAAPIMPRASGIIVVSGRVAGQDIPEIQPSYENGAQLPPLPLQGQDLSKENTGGTPIKGEAVQEAAIKLGHLAANPANGDAIFNNAADKPQTEPSESPIIQTSAVDVSGIRDREVAANHASAKTQGGSMPNASLKLPNSFKIAVIQMAVGDESKEARLLHVQELLKDARGADLIMLPELWNVGYFSFDQYKNGSESLAGATVKLLREKAVEMGAHIMMGSFVERSKSGLHNTTVFIDPQGKIAATYRKIHLFGFGSDERRLLTPGKNVSAVPTANGSLGMSTCFDLRFPELYRRLLDRGAKMFLIASAWPHPRLEHWEILTRSRAIENQAFLAAANCAGTNRGKQYCGHSVILDSFGKVMAEAGEKEAILTAKINLKEVDEARETFPAVKSRVLK